MSTVQPGAVAFRATLLLGGKTATGMLPALAEGRR
jgi:hypothetical protein